MVNKEDMTKKYKISRAKTDTVPYFSKHWIS